MDLRLDLLRYYRWLRQYGLNDSHSGNISIRSAQDFWISPTGAGADTLQADELIRCPLEGELTKGASLDARLHQLVYAANSPAQAIIHSHGPYSLTVTFSGDDFVPVDFEGQYYFSTVPVVDIAYERYLSDSPQQVADALTRSPLVVVRGHGVYCCAENLDLAYKWTCSLESSAKLAYLNRQFGQS